VIATSGEAIGNRRFEAQDSSHLGTTFISNLENNVVSAFHTFAGLDLEEPYRDINSDPQRPTSLVKLFNCKLRQGDSLAGPDFFVDAATT
jgi:hypothetical protein